MASVSNAALKLEKTPSTLRSITALELTAGNIEDYKDCTFILEPQTYLICPSYGRVIGSWDVMGTPLKLKKITDYSKRGMAILDLTFVRVDGAVSSALMHQRHNLLIDTQGGARFEEQAAEYKKTYRCRDIINKRFHRTVGSDPEIFAVSGKGDLIPSFHFLGSKKDSDFYNNPGYWDGYQGEFVTDPSTCLELLTNSTQRALRYIQTKLDSLNHPDGGKLTLKNVFDIPQERLTKDNPKYVKFGCNPSLNVYGEEPMSVDYRSVHFRSAGGHLHFSVDNKKDIPDMVKMLDKTLGIICVAMFQYYDEPRRRALYGRAGEYRRPPYGFEYRVLSNAWLAHPALVHLVYDLARNVLGQVGADSELNKLWDVTEDEVRTCINFCDVEMAKSILKRNEQGLNLILNSLPALYDYTEPVKVQKGELAGAKTEAWKNVIFRGVHKFLRNPDFLSEAWQLTNTTWQCTSIRTAGTVANATPVLISTKYLD